MNILKLQKQKQNKQKISMLTCYDCPSARVIEATDIDCILVGDSVAMVVHGYENTTMATMDMMVMHTQAVCRGTQKFVIADLPFMSYRKSLADTIINVQRLIQAGAHAVKLEGVEGNLDTISHIVHSGVPVVGHLGLTPQHVNVLGGYKVQGRDEAARTNLLNAAKQLQAAGCFMLVLECIPADLAATVTAELMIPTIGIGAGPDTDGQVLVWHDLLGLQKNIDIKFVKKYLNGFELQQQVIINYDNEVKQQVFPSIKEHVYI